MYISYIQVWIFLENQFLESFGGMWTVNDVKTKYYNLHGYVFFITSHVYLLKGECTVQYYPREVMSIDKEFSSRFFLKCELTSTGIDLL